MSTVTKLFRFAIDHPNSVVDHLMISPRADILKAGRSLEREALRNMPLTSHKGALSITPGYAFDRGVGRSLRALILGSEYKIARRVYGEQHEFSYMMFNVAGDNRRHAEMYRKRSARRYALQESKGF